ncbi:MAG: hypothetical protein AABX33_03145 [Nanoarchaeota archaeon]
MNNFKLIRAVLLILVTNLIIVSGCATPTGVVKNPTLPTSPKPVDFQYCESDDDCTSTYIKENNCCFSCGTSVNIEGERYLQEWFDFNCKDIRKKEGCLDLECCGVTDIKCENNRCTLRHECT